MLFLIRGCTFSACKYYENITYRTKVFELYHPRFRNLKRELPNSKLFCSENTTSVIDVNVRRYLNHIMREYQKESKKIDGTEMMSEILKLHMIPLLLNDKIKITENIKALKDLVSNNEEMEKLVKEEELIYEQQLLEVDEKILDVILKYLCTESYDSVIMEIVPGIGGHEAMLFAKDLLSMYTGYFDYLGFTYEVMELIENDTGGLRKTALIISDSNAYKKLKFESGVHRVQRIPATEKSGRLHTSTAVVTILPEPKDIDINLEEKDLKIESKKASGAGGQHVNTTNSAIRITHLPTGKVVTCQTDRSQLKNKKLALLKLKSMLYEEHLDRQDSFISDIRKKQMGSRLRNEKIRTYNYNQDRVTDHRISNGTIHNLKEFMRGGVSLEELEDRLQRHMQEKILLDMIERIKNELK